MTEQLGTWMTRMEEKVDGLRNDMADLKAMRGRVAEHHESLYGNGKPGLVLSVDRLTQSSSLFKWAIGIMLGCAATAGVDLISRLFFK